VVAVRVVAELLRSEAPRSPASACSPLTTSLLTVLLLALQVSFCRDRCFPTGDLGYGGSGASELKIQVNCIPCKF
jgi:hypothetical protein